jgi:PilZ domain
LADAQSTDRRSNPRRAADWRVLFGPPGDLSLGFLADMSPIGVSILSEKLYSAGTEVEVHFGVQDDNLSGKFQMRAVVRHCAKGRIGVQFVNVDPSQREHWWKIMRGDF